MPFRDTKKTHPQDSINGEFMKKSIGLISLLFCSILNAQTISEVINSVDTVLLNLTLNEFSGEIPTLVGGSSVTILNRGSNQNGTAADYITEKFESYDNLTVEQVDYSANGTNIVATQTGETNPDDIYIICAHYDALADYCANDNATGTVAVLEIARILSNYCIDNSIKYILFDEEEIGLYGSENYANQAVSDNLNILGVINLDMLGYDSNQNDDAPIHVKNIANSLALKNDAVDVLNTYAAEIGLTPTVVIPGVDLSDHASFWSNNISAIMVTDPADFSELTPFYHTDGDRVSTLDLSYFYKMTKFIAGIVSSKAGLIENSNCDLMSTNHSNETLNRFKIFPNPTSENLNIIINDPNSEVFLYISDAAGKIVLQKCLENKSDSIYVGNLKRGIYSVTLEMNNEIFTKSIVLD